MKAKFLQLMVMACLVFTLNSAACAAERMERKDWAEAMVAARTAYLQSTAASVVSSTPSFQPFDTGPLDGTGPARQLAVNIAGLQKLRLVTICEEGVANCNIWGEPKLIASDGSVTRLTDLKPTRVHVGWGQLLVDKNWQDHPLMVGDRQFEFGFWAHADSELVFDLDGKYERFEAFVGEDRDRATGTVRFKVLTTPRPLPDGWTDLVRQFPLQCGWLRAAAGRDGVADWFNHRADNAWEKAIIGRMLQKTKIDSSLTDELQALGAAEVSADDSRWLELFCADLPLP